jgi:hypothetical protein
MGYGLATDVAGWICDVARIVARHNLFVHKSLRDLAKYIIYFYLQ